MTSISCSVTREMLETIVQYHGWGQHPIWPPEATGIFHEPLMSSWVAAASGLLCVFVPGVLLGRLTACLGSGPREAGTPELPLDLVPQF